MALTEIPIELSSTPSIVDGGNATAITIDSSENVGIGGSPSTTLTVVGSGDAETGATITHSRSGVGYSLLLNNTNNGANKGSGIKWQGGGFDTAAIIGRSDATAASGDAPGYLTFHTSADGSEGLNERMRIDSSGQVGIGNISPAQTLEIHNSVAGDYTDFGLRGTGHKYVIGVGNDAVATVNDKWYLYDNDNSAFRMVVDTAGRVGIGTTAPAKELHVVGNGHMFTLENTSTGTDQYTQQLFQSGTALNYLWGANQNSTAWGGASSLNIQSSSGAIAFFTAGSTLRMRIHETSGNIDIPNGNLSFASGHGIDFSATANSGTTGATHTGSLLDDYEEGYWTPVAIGSSGGTSSMGQALGSYTKIGNLVHLTWYIGISGGNATGSINLIGLPYAALGGGTVNNRITTGSCMFDSLLLNSGRTQVSPYMSHGTSTMQFYQSGSNLGWITIPVDSTWSMIGGITYRTV